KSANLPTVVSHIKRINSEFPVRFIESKVPPDRRMARLGAAARPGQGVRRLPGGRPSAIRYRNLRNCDNSHHHRAFSFFWRNPQRQGSRRSAAAGRARACPARQDLVAYYAQLNFRSGQAGVLFLFGPAVGLRMGDP
ncbi:hypothetical protein, partial [Achromobacter insuavis]|uniref:hypothetical protein n=1 Tax=Achromobacter insuavis TaxID=1287735 RepID=UPI001F13719C